MQVVYKLFPAQNDVFIAWWGKAPRKDLVEKSVQVERKLPRVDIWRIPV